MSPHTENPAQAPLPCSLWARIGNRAWNWVVRRTLEDCAHQLITLGHDNGARQKHINDAKDAIYRALWGHK